MFLWNPRMVSFMKDASENSSYHENLVSKFKAYLPENSNVCDAGCGLGYLSLAMSKCCKSVTSVDVSHESLNVLQNNISKRNIKNITVIEGKVENIPPKILYDAMVFCFFGGTEQIIKIAKSQCRGSVIIISKNYEKHRFTLSNKPIERFTFRQTKERLTSLNIPYISYTFAPEMGQPFKTAEDAVDFFRLYSKDPEPQNIKKEDIIDRLLYRPTEEFPYYLPLNKQVGMIVLNTNDIPTNINTL